VKHPIDDEHPTETSHNGAVAIKSLMSFPDFGAIPIVDIEPLGSMSFRIRGKNT
jgi:hypothetical protein